MPIGMGGGGQMPPDDIPMGGQTGMPPQQGMPMEGQAGEPMPGGEGDDLSVVAEQIVAQMPQEALLMFAQLPEEEAITKLFDAALQELGDEEAAMELAEVAYRLILAQAQEGSGQSLSEMNPGMAQPAEGPARAKLPEGGQYGGSEPTPLRP